MYRRRWYCLSSWYYFNNNRKATGVAFPWKGQNYLQLLPHRVLYSVRQSLNRVWNGEGVLIPPPNNNRFWISLNEAIVFFCKESFTAGLFFFMINIFVLPKLQASESSKNPWSQPFSYPVMTAVQPESIYIKCPQISVWTFGGITHRRLFVLADLRPAGGQCVTIFNLRRRAATGSTGCHSTNNSILFFHNKRCQRHFTQRQFTGKFFLFHKISCLMSRKCPPSRGH